LKTGFLRWAALTAVLVWVIPRPVFAEAPVSSRELNLQISSMPEAKLGFTQRFLFPFLQGENFLTEDNNIALALSAEISPISLNGLAETVWTPIAFLQLSLGGRIGSGWNLKLFDQDIYGIGLNQDDGSGQAEHTGSAFDGLLWKTHAGTALQFDLAALIPGEWHHVIARTYHEINYRGYTAASSGESWYYENDGGENTNGFNYYGNLFIGYQMPLFLNMAGLLAEGTLFLYDTPGRSQWGEDKIFWTFSGLFNFTITKQIGAAVLVQFRTVRNYTDPNAEDLYYRRRHVDKDDLLRLEFYRVVAAFTYKF
jgi:hypothetical protein